jgi:hypothetical protein
LSLPHSTADRIFEMCVAIMLCYFFVVVPVQDTRTNYWLLRDGQQGVAVVTKVLWTGHNALAYRYSVSGRQYKGQDRRNWRDPRYANVVAGEETVVYYSLSHPELSRLTLPETVLVGGLPVILLVWFVIVLLVITAVKPDNKWGLNPRAKQSSKVAQSLRPEGTTRKES